MMSFGGMAAVLLLALSARANGGDPACGAFPASEISPATKRRQACAVSMPARSPLEF